MPNNNNITTDISLAAELLKTGKLVAFPTETVYGLGADANNPEAIANVFATKGRPTNHPLIVHIAKTADLDRWAQNIPTSAWQLATHFWPGPLTLILEKQDHVSPLITGGQQTIALRIPAHPQTLQLLQKIGSGLVGPSANKYGRVSPTTALHVAADLGNEIAAILDGGACDVGIESTIVDLTDDMPIIRRSGAITADDIGQVLGLKVQTSVNSQANIRTPGDQLSHYAPITPIKLIKNTELISTVKTYLQLKKKFSVLSLQNKPDFLPTQIYWQQVNNDATIYMHDLYANLRVHDELNNAAIIIEIPPNNNDWLAIQDRLARAAF